MATVIMVNRDRKKQPHGIPDVHEIRKFCRIIDLLRSVVASFGSYKKNGLPSLGRLDAS
jgi:hypothetical protein